MIIGIDGNEANVEQRVGISEYAFELLKEFRKYEVGSMKYEVYLKTLPLKTLPQEDENWRYRVIGPKELWTQVRLPFDLYLHKPRPDVFFSPTHYAPRFSPVPTIVSVMDLSYIFFPELFNKSDLYQLRNWTAYSVRQASRILTISKYSKNAIIEEYGVSEDRVVVTYPGLKEMIGLTPQIYTMNRLQSHYGIHDRYILFVGTLQPRKNIVRLVEAFSQAVEDEKDLQLVIVGKKGWMYEEILAAPKKFNVEERVKFLDFVSDEELPSLYQHAECFVLPSLYEGFGLPVLEAMQYGCPVITSKVSSLPEAGGDAALYVDPEDVADIAKKIKRLLSDKALRKEMIEKGKKQVAKFSWEKTARETLAVLQDVAEEK